MNDSNAHKKSSKLSQNDSDDEGEYTPSRRKLGAAPSFAPAGFTRK